MAESTKQVKPIREITSSELADSLGDVTDRVFAGETHVLTKHGRVRMYLVPPERYEAKFGKRVA